MGIRTPPKAVAIVVVSSMFACVPKSTLEGFPESQSCTKFRPDEVTTPPMNVSLRATALADHDVVQFMQNVVKAHKEGRRWELSDAGVAGHVQRPAVKRQIDSPGRGMAGSGMGAGASFFVGRSAAKAGVAVGPAAAPIRPAASNIPASSVFSATNITPSSGPPQIAALKSTRHAQYPGARVRLRSQARAGSSVGIGGLANQTWPPWLHEVKHNEFRISPRKRGERVEVRSRFGTMFTGRFS